MTQAPRPLAEVIIGLDVGTTGVKAVAFGLASPWWHVAIREYPLLEPAPGWQVQEPETILDASAAALSDCVRDAGGAEVVAISVSSAMHGLIGLDAAMQPITRLVTWADARASEEARSLRASGQAADVRRHTGAPVHPMTPLTKLMWFARHEPRTCAAVRWWVSLKDHLLWWLTGTLVTELSSASATGLLEMATRSPVGPGDVGRLSRLAPRAHARAPRSRGARGRLPADRRPRRPGRPARGSELGPRDRRRAPVAAVA